MSDKRIVRYVKENLLAGYSVAEIKKHLLQYHHREENINEVISIVSKDYENGLLQP